MLQGVGILIICILLSLDSFCYDHIFAKTNSLVFYISQAESDFDIWKWIEDHAAVVTGLGVLVTLVTFITEKWILAIKDKKRILELKIDYYDVIFQEISKIKEYLEKPRINEFGSEIYDFEFSTNSFDEIPNPYEVRSGGDTMTNAAILDFYSFVKSRNKTYAFRNEVKNAHLLDAEDRNHKAFVYLSDLDQKINEEERMIEISNDEILEIVEFNRNYYKRKRNFWKTKIGF